MEKQEYKINLKHNELLALGFIDLDDEQPKAEQRVYVICETIRSFFTNGICEEKLSYYQTMAEFIPYMTVKESDYMNDDFSEMGDYNEEEDEYYTPEGFYEWQSVPDINWIISDRVVMWKPLFSLKNPNK